MYPEQTYLKITPARTCEQRLFGRQVLEKEKMTEIKQENSEKIHSEKKKHQFFVDHSGELLSALFHTLTVSKQTS